MSQAGVKTRWARRAAGPSADTIDEFMSMSATSVDAADAAVAVDRAIREEQLKKGEAALLKSWSKRFRLTADYLLRNEQAHHARREHSVAATARAIADATILLETRRNELKDRDSAADFLRHVADAVDGVVETTGKPEDAELARLVFFEMSRSINWTLTRSGEDPIAPDGLLA